MRCRDSLVFCFNLLRFAIDFEFGSFLFSFCWGGACLFRALLVSLRRGLLAQKMRLRFVDRLLSPSGPNSGLLFVEKDIGRRAVPDRLFRAQKNPFWSRAPALFFFQVCHFLKELEVKKWLPPKRPWNLKGTDLSDFRRPGLGWAHLVHPLGRFGSREGRQKRSFEGKNP